MILQDYIKNFLAGYHQTFSYSPYMGSCRRADYPLNSFLTQRTCNLFLIPAIKTLLYFVIRPNKVCTIVRVDNGRFTSPCDKPSKTHHEGISRQGVGHFQTYSSSYKAGEKTTIPFSLLPEMLYVQRFKETYPNF